MRLTWCLAMLVACSGETEPPITDRVCDLDAGVCRAAFDAAHAVCDWGARCGWLRDPDSCTHQVVLELCAVNDCTANYDDWDRLYMCIAQYDSACVATATCSL